MPGSVTDLTVAGARFPDPIIVDTNLIVEFLVAPLIEGRPLPRTTANARRADQFFSELHDGNGTGLVTPTVFNEVIHISIRFKYKQVWFELRTGSRATYRRPIRDWTDLYKQDRTILQSFSADLQRLRQRFVANGLHFVAPDELDAIASGRTYDDELLHLVGTHGLDSNDALILMEAQRYGVTDIITLDSDMLRARADFNIYTWL
ncbi:MAG: PIN domain-containing protein [Chloroflexota bacterium]|nr:PIN domain-containing protein [Chloroflexota bacterium]